MKLTAACAFGLEAIVKRELSSLGYEPFVSQPGRVSFEGDWRAICRTNVWLRSADRVLIEALRFPAPDFDALFETVKAFEWERFIPTDASFPVVGKSRHSKLTSLPAIQRSVKRALVEGLKRGHHCETLAESGPTYKVEVALLNDEATLTLDTTGPSLHKRGYRKLVGEAPLKETLAAALVTLSVWNKERSLIDPFCGSGTIPIEAALIGLNIAPGRSRKFACSQWPEIDASLWQDAVVEADDSQIRDYQLSVSGFDRSPEMLSLARYHAKAAGVESQIHFQEREFSELRSKREFGCLISNPPYGERLSDHRALLPLYESMPMVLQRLPTWSHFILTSLPRFERVIQKSATRRRKLYNGRIECTYYQFLGPKPPRNETAKQELPVDVSDQDSRVESADARIDIEKKSAEPVFGGLQSKDKEQADLFGRRLVKRARHLRRWPKRGITCFRIYERDIPEIPLVVDRYENFLHITEYERPHDRDLARHSAWLELMTQTAATTLDIPIQNTFLKRRLKSSSGSDGEHHGNGKTKQYQKIANQKKLFQVQEAGLKFFVNLTDYVDTGLFLDHRTTRQMVQSQAKGKKFLNLFAYTGSFSVYAAAGGAKSTTTVDWSNTYIDWARQNMQLNGFTGNNHHYIVDNAVDFVQKAQFHPVKFDLVVVDPPTFSNSKKSEEDWNVQTCHASFLEQLHGCLEPEAIVFFSNNYRRFQLHDAAIGNFFDIIEISKQTIPEDFRNKRIHRCWKLIKKRT